MSLDAVPWRRYWARYFDYLLHSVIVVLIWAYLDPESLDAINRNLLTFLLTVFWILLDGVYMAYFGTTVGKKLMKIRVETQEGQKLSRYLAFKRSRLVWLRGMGLGLGIIEFIANLVAFGKLKKNGVTTWDRDLELNVTHGKIGLLRYLVCPIFVVGIVSFVIYAVVQEL